MNAAVPAAVRQPLLRRVLIVNLLLTLLLYVVLVAAALFTLTQAAERVARADIAAELRVLARRAEDLKVVAFVNAIDYRIEIEPGDAPTQSLYLILHHDGSKVAGNLAHWPQGLPVVEGRLRFDGAQAGAGAGRVVAEATRLDGDFLLLVGRRLELVDAMLRRFLPTATVLLVGFLALASLLTLNTARQFRRRIAATNAVFESLRRGDLKQRIEPSIVQGGDELAELAGNINAALMENERLVKGLDAFSQTAAHELNRELSYLRDEARANDAPRFAGAAERLIGLLREILTLAKVGGSSGFESRALDPEAFVTAAAELYRDAALPGGVELIVDTSSVAGARVHGVEEHLRGAVMNLIENALKHSPPGSTVSVLVRAEEQAVTISVRDQGPGASSEDLTALIAAGSQGPAAGHGFGLRFVQAVAIRYGARIHLRNTHPGFEVTLRFPRADVPTPAA
ncbi:MAG: hypothetical protein PGMFKBFP_02781 [Anaerolineales bacterium]|nr:hypothetical protein [Anaerolineales bacterium]